MFIYVRPVYPRTSWEKIFKQIYNLCLVLLFGAWVLEFTQFYTRVGATYDGYWSATEFRLAPTMDVVLANCNRTLSLEINGITTSVKVDRESLPYHFLTTTHAMYAVFIVSGVLIFFDFVVKTNFVMNQRHLRWRGYHFPLNTLLTATVYFLSIAVISMIATIHPQRTFLKDYLAQCTLEFNSRGTNRLSEAASDVVFATSLNLLLSGVIINLAGYVFGFIKLLSDGMREPVEKMLKEEFPWERGFTCKPQKELLINETIRRKYAEARIMGHAPPPRAIEAVPLAAAEGGPATAVDVGAPRDGSAPGDKYAAPGTADAEMGGVAPRMQSYGDGTGAGEGDAYLEAGAPGVAEELDVEGGDGFDDGNYGYGDEEPAYMYSGDYGRDGKRRHRHRRRPEETEEERAERRARRAERRRLRAEETGDYAPEGDGADGVYDANPLPPNDSAA